MSKMSAKQIEVVRARAFDVISDALPSMVDHMASKPQSVAHEVAARIAENAKLVDKKKLRDQVLLVLADYHDHAFTAGKLKEEGKRLQLADMILKGAR